MIIRLLEKDDIPRLKKLHSISGFKYPFPDLRELLEIPVIVDENNQIVMAVGLMPTVEAYLWTDTSWETPGIRSEAVKLLHKYCEHSLIKIGIVGSHVFVPPELEKKFGRRLIKLGWKRSYWPCFWRRVKNG